MSFWYLATPYTAYADGTLEEAFDLACVAAAELIEQGLPVFSPIAHSHPIALLGDLDPTSHALWLVQDEYFIQVAEGIIVLKAAGWQNSKGIFHEIQRFAELKKPLFYWNPVVSAKDFLDDLRQRT